MAATALLWAVHDEFLRYMARIEDGQVAVVDGAEQLPGGGFRFPVMDDAGAAERSAGHDARRGNSTRFRGAVVCTGHHEMLTVTIAAPELLRQEGAMALVIDDPFSPGERMPMAHLRPSSQDPRQFLDGRLRRGSLELLPYLGRCTDWHGWKRIDAAERQGATARRVRAKLHNAREQRLLAAAALLNPTDAAAPTRTRRASSEGLPRLSIVFGTESGNAELVAEELGAALSEHLDVTVGDIAALDPQDPASALELEVPHLMICSTYGDG